MSDWSKEVLPDALFAHLERWKPELGIWQKVLFVVVGSAAYSSFLMLFIVGVFSSMVFGGGEPFQCIYLVVSFFSGLLITCTVGWGFSDAISSKLGFLLLSVFAALAPMLAMILFLVVPSFSSSVVSFAVLGFCVAGFLMLTSGYIGSLSRELLIIDVPACLGLAALGSTIVLYVRPIIVCWLLVCLIAILGSLSSLCVYRITSSEGNCFVSSEDSKKRNRMSWKSSAASLSQSCCLGYAMSLIVLLGLNGYEHVILLSGFIVVVVAFAMALDCAGNRAPILVSEKNQLRFFLPCAAVGLLPIAFVDSLLVKIICCCVLLFVFTVQAITNIYAVSENVYLFSLQPIRTYTASRISNYIGYVAGSLIALFSFGYGMELNAVSEMLTLAMIVVLAFLAALFFSDRFPVEESSASQDGGMFPSDGRLLTADDRLEGIEIPMRLTSWKNRCAILSKRIGLSPRQEEVLVLLSRGYSAKYIEEHLFISYHTVKSHIHSIYQKAGVHSREELIEMIEGIAVE